MPGGQERGERGRGVGEVWNVSPEPTPTVALLRATHRHFTLWMPHNNRRTAAGQLIADQHTTSQAYHNRSVWGEENVHVLHVHIHRTPTPPHLIPSPAQNPHIFNPHPASPLYTHLQQLVLPQQQRAEPLPLLRQRRVAARQRRCARAQALVRTEHQADERGQHARDDDNERDEGVAPRWHPPGVGVHHTARGGRGGGKGGRRSGGRGQEAGAMRRHRATLAPTRSGRSVCFPESILYTKIVFIPFKRVWLCYAAAQPRAWEIRRKQE
eukprot:266517-Chlamydomonas_euryale.AAC.1